MHKLVIGWHLIDVQSYFQINKNGALTGIYRAFQDAYALQSTLGDALLVDDVVAELGGFGCHLWQYTKL